MNASHTASLSASAPVSAPVSAPASSDAGFNADADAAGARSRRLQTLVVAVAAVLALVLLWSMVSVLQAQVAKAEQREALIQAQRQEVARCWQQGASALMVRACVADVRWRTANALDESYGLPGRVRPVAVSDVSLVSLR